MDEWTAWSLVCYSGSPDRPISVTSPACQSVTWPASLSGHTMPVAVTWPASLSGHACQSRSRTQWPHLPVAVTYSVATPASRGQLLSGHTCQSRSPGQPVSVTTPASRGHLAGQSQWPHLSVAVTWPASLSGHTCQSWSPGRPVSVATPASRGHLAGQSQWPRLPVALTWPASLSCHACQSRSPGRQTYTADQMAAGSSHFERLAAGCHWFQESLADWRTVRSAWASDADRH